MKIHFDENGVKASVQIQIQAGSLAQDVIIHQLSPEAIGYLKSSRDDFKSNFLGKTRLGTIS